MILNPPQGAPLVDNMTTGSRRWSSIDSYTFFGYDAMLDSPSSWVSKTNDVNQWMSMDLGAVHTVSGVVTQGRGDADEWVTHFTIGYSTNVDPHPCQWTYTADAKVSLNSFSVNTPTTSESKVRSDCNSHPTALVTGSLRRGISTISRGLPLIWWKGRPNSSVDAVWAKKCIDGYSRVGPNDIFNGNSDRNTQRSSRCFRRRRRALGQGQRQGVVGTDLHARGRAGRAGRRRRSRQHARDCWNAGAG